MKKTVFLLLVFISLISFGSILPLGTNWSNMVFEPITLNNPSAVVFQPRILRIALSTDQSSIEESKFKLTAEGTFSLSLGSLAIHAGVATYSPLITLEEVSTLKFDNFYIAGGISLGEIFVSINAKTNDLLNISSYEDGDIAFGIVGSYRWGILFPEFERVEISYTVANVIDYSTGTPNLKDSIEWGSGTITLLIEAIERVPVALRFSLKNLKSFSEEGFSADNIDWEALLSLGAVSLYVKNNGTDWIFGAGTRIFFINFLGRYCTTNGDYLVNAWIDF